MNALATPSIEELQDTLRLVDGISQRTFGHIDAMATLALRSLEHPGGIGVGGLDRIACVLEAIASMACDTMSDINCEAERMGAHFVDEAAHRRGDAWRRQAASARSAA